MAAILGMVASIFFTKSALVQRAPQLVFWLTLVAEIILIKAVYQIGGDLWARFTFSFAMGVLAFMIKLLR
jgi:hypothetical protein